MFGDLELTGLDFDPAVLEAYAGACLVIAGLVVLFNKLNSYSAYDTDRGLLTASARKPTSSPAPPGGTGPAVGENGGKQTSAEVRARLKADPRNRRASNRRGGRPVKVLLSDPEGIEPPMVCWVIDRSRGGLGLVVPQLLPVGAVLDVRAAHAPEGTPPLRVEVRHCRRRGNSWRAGCKFTAEVPWITLLLFG